MEIILRVKSKADASVQNVRHSLNGRMVLGRGTESAVPLEAPGISREHLAMEVEDSALMLTDLSSNGTWLNGARMPQRRKCRVRAGDVVELPGYEIQCQLAGPRPAQVATVTAAGSANTINSVSHSSDVRAHSFMASFSTLELFLLTVTLASLVLLVVYLAS